jgi:hypothetical protein
MTIRHEVSEMSVRERGAGRSGRWLLAVGLLALGACSFDAENPAAITDSGLSTPSALEALVNGVIGEYDFAYQRSALYSGLIADEIRAAGSWQEWHRADKQGVLDLDASTGDLMNIPHHWWLPLSRARFLADDAYRRIAAQLPDAERNPLAAMSRLYAGLAYHDIAEYFCRAAYDGGPAVERAQSLALAEERLTQAISIARAASNDSIAQMAHLTRARVRLAAGNAAGALSDVREVRAGFRWNAQFRNAAGEDNNMVFQLNQRGEGTIEEPFRGTGDPRVPVVATTLRGPDNQTIRFDQNKLDRYGNMPLGKWQEARLIEAEVLLGQGDVAGTVAALNLVRAGAGLVPLGSGLTAEQATAALRQERRLEHFLEGRRMIDMRRFQEFPAGWQASCVPLPRVETGANPNL